jgi:hypothetical protein
MSPQQDKRYAVFLSYNSEDRAAVEQLAIYLQDRVNLHPWLDKWELIPGESWVENLERGLAESATCAIFVGQSGKGPWQEQEVKLALRQQVKNPDFRVIPVLLPDAPQQPELPAFLSGNMWVDFRNGLHDDDALWRLECGICGEPPGRGRPKPQPEVILLKLQEIPEQARTKQPSEKMPRTPVIRLRSEPLVVLTDEAQKIFKVKKNWPAWLLGYKPFEYIQNEFEDWGETVIDHVTGLMWQKSGSMETLTYQKARAYIEQLNHKRFAGYTDWRLPTVAELISLIEPEKQANKLYINPIFDKRQRWCWSADTRSSAAAWDVDFENGSVGWGYLSNIYYVRGVRS